MSQKLVEKIQETSEQEVNKSRRNFLKYLTGGLAVGGLGYLGYEIFREPSLKERLEKAPNNEERAKLLVKASYETPDEVKKLFFNEKTRSEYKNFDMANIDEESLINCENFYKNSGILIDLPNNRNFSEGDKLTYFIYQDIW